MSVPRVYSGRHRSYVAVVRQLVRLSFFVPPVSDVVIFVSRARSAHHRSLKTCPAGALRKYPRVAAVSGYLASPQRFLRDFLLEREREREREISVAILQHSFLPHFGL